MPKRLGPKRLGAKTSRGQNGLVPKRPNTYSVNGMFAVLVFVGIYDEVIWAALWQNQQNDYAPSKDSDHPRHPPSLTRVFALHSMGCQGPKLSSCGEQRLWSDWVDAKADLGLRWAHMAFCWFYHELAHLINTIHHCCLILTPYSSAAICVWIHRFLTHDKENEGPNTIIA